MNTVLIRNIISMLIWQGSNYLVPLITLPYLSRVLGVHTFGEVAYSYAFVAYFVLVTEWGFSLSSSRLISKHSQDRKAVSEIFWDTLAAKFLIFCVAVLALLVITLSVPSLRAISTLILPASLAVLANLLTVNWCLQGLERLDYFAAGSLIGKMATVPLIFLFVKGPDDAWMSISIQTGGLVFSGLLSIILLTRMQAIDPPNLSLRRAVRQIFDGWYVFLSTAAVNLYTTSNIVILGSLVGSAGVGQYSGADRLKTAAQGVISPIGNAVYPRVAKLMNQDLEAGYRFIRRLLIIQGGMTFLISATLFVFASPIVLIILGSHFVEAVPIMRWLAWLPFIIGLSNIFGLQVLLQTNHQKLFSRIIVAAVPISLGCIFPFVWLFGPVGGGMAAVITESFVLVAMTVAAMKTNPRLFQWRKHEPNPPAS